MDDGADAELRALRARAYAPGGDIADDPAALARLSELEARRRERPARVTAARADAAPAVEAVSVAAEPHDAAADVPAADEDAVVATAAGFDAAPPRRARGLRTALMWGGSLVAVAVLAAGVTLFATARTAFTATALPEDAAVTHLTTLLPTGGEQPPFLRDYGADQARTFESFFGLETYQVSVPWIDADEACILLMSGAQAEAASNSGWSSFGQGCSAGAFPASLSFVVTGEYPDEFREHFPDGSALQFVLTDTGVDVFVSNAPAQPAI
ncbi:hypothetical protein [Microbacterium oleivorans]|uniref:Uncharacterized protein n=1 Tax=Microbacterium oleivorans TaxID=273677 RepID=A0A7D5EWN8_9MICO|nr:hypothetical protein [Microbacterium oleivorans]QLD12111.1 hypothetical protein HW566_10245 [Microbacterium oleivorans]